MGLPRSIFRQYAGENELLLALKSGEIDSIARGEIGNRYQQGLDHSVLTIDLRDFVEGFAMSIDPTNVDLQKHLAEALKLATKDGALDFRQWSDNPSIFSDWYVANTTGGVPQSFLSRLCLDCPLNAPKHAHRLPSRSRTQTAQSDHTRLYLSV